MELVTIGSTSSGYSIPPRVEYPGCPMHSPCSLISLHEAYSFGGGDSLPPVRVKERSNVVLFQRSRQEHSHRAEGIMSEDIREHYPRRYSRSATQGKFSSISAAWRSSLACLFFSAIVVLMMNYVGIQPSCTKKRSRYQDYVANWCPRAADLCYVRIPYL